MLAYVCTLICAQRTAPRIVHTELVLLLLLMPFTVRLCQSMSLQFVHWYKCMHAPQRIPVHCSDSSYSNSYWHTVTPRHKLQCSCCV
jgi:hypothetical protein